MTASRYILTDTPQVWIFNPDIRYTHHGTNLPIRGVRIFWQTTKPGERVATDSLKSTGFEPLELDENTFDSMKTCLEASNSVLPGDVGTSGEWKVGALRRFEETKWLT